MRIALCIGCNAYDNLSTLRGAEEDARQMFEVLTDSGLGGYDKNASLLLLSPTLTEVRSALEKMLFSGTSLSDFTLFFAGHGGVAHDTLYLALRDTKLPSIAITGLAFADLAKAVVAAKPSQANFVLDACNSGGLGLDLPSILRQSLTGTAETTGVAALAAAAADEYAAEIPEGGAFTTALLRVLRGEEVLQSHKPYLDIPEIGANLRPILGEGNPQTVSTWVLNLQGPNRFSQNPNYSGDPTVHPDMSVAALGNRFNLPKHQVTAIRRITLEVREHIEELEIAGLLERLTAELSPDQASILLSGLAEGVTEEARHSADQFAPGRILGVFVGQLLKLADRSDTAKRYLPDFLARSRDADLTALYALNDQLENHCFRLIAPESLADLFYLPLRVSDVLGRIGFLLLRTDLDPEDVSFLKSITKKLLDIYGNAIRAVSDEQAAPIAIFVSAAHQRGWVDESEEVIGRLYNDLTHASARVARHFLGGQQALRFLDERYELPGSFDDDIHQHPSDLATATLVLASLLKLDETVDRSMILLDHTSLNVLIPDEVSSLGNSGRVPGKNFGLTTGHGVWRCIDIRREWNESVRPLLLGAQIVNMETEHAALFSAMTLRDRVPWIVVARAFQPIENEQFTHIEVQ
ncbi:MAG: hypothetical protein DI527_14705 [Chelatococcus sp.]|nr:MAG: hypothetical protein DI527_14705 [Chelatococcus sp.]